MTELTENHLWQRPVSAVARLFALVLAVLAALAGAMPTGNAAPDQPEMALEAAVAVQPDEAAPSRPVSKQIADAKVSTEEMFAAFDANAEEARDRLLAPQNDLTGDERTKLNDLRRRLAADRDKASSLADRGTTAARVLEAQIASLGVVPAEGVGEPAAVTARREELQEQLGVVLTPTFRLREASARASVLVSELDERLNAIKNARLSERGLAPIDPRLWLRSGGEIANAITIARSHIATSFTKYSLGEIAAALATALGLILIGPIGGMVLWRRLGHRLSAWILQENSIARRLVVAVVADAVAGLFFAFALLAGVFALMIFLVPLVPVLTLASMVSAVVTAGLFVAIAQWIGRGILCSPFPELRLVTLPPARAKAALSSIRYMAAVLGIEIVIGSLEESGSIGSNFASLASAIMVGIGAWLLWRLANFLREGRRFYDEMQAADPVRAGEPAGLDFSTPIARLLKLFAIVSLIAALVGYELVSRFFFSASLLSLSIIGIAVYLHRSFVMVVTAFAKSSLARFRRGLHLLPLLTGLIETILVALLLAVIWGYDANEITDGIIKLRTGIEFGEIKISLGDVFTFAAVFFIGYFITRWLQRFLKISIMPEFGMDSGAEAAILTFIGYIGIFMAALIAIATTGLDLSSLAFVAGALSVGLGFGLQSVVENFTSGILLLIERPIKVGDWIEVGEHSGIVRKIAVRSTHIETFDRHQIIVPNSQLISGVVKNRSFSTGPARIVVPVGVAYGTDLDRVRELLLEIAHENENVLKDPEPAVAMEGFGDSSINVKILAFVQQATDGAPTTSALNFTIARRFADEGIEIPFPQRDLHLRTIPDGFAPGGNPSQGSLPSGDAAGPKPA